jgi:hypothetical protein
MLLIYALSLVSYSATISNLSSLYFCVAVIIIVDISELMAFIYACIFSSNEELLLSGFWAINYVNFSIKKLSSNSSSTHYLRNYDFSDILLMEIIYFCDKF